MWLIIELSEGRANIEMAFRLTPENMTRQRFQARDFYISNGCFLAIQWATEVPLATPHGSISYSTTCIDPIHNIDNCLLSILLAIETTTTISPPAGSLSPSLRFDQLPWRWRWAVGRTTSQVMLERWRATSGTSWAQHLGFWGAVQLPMNGPVWQEL